MALEGMSPICFANVRYGSPLAYAANMAGSPESTAAMPKNSLLLKIDVGQTAAVR